MKFAILDKKTEGSKYCFLVKASIEDYLSILPSDYNSYEIQRSIVSNTYLDKLVYTVLERTHIPYITLVSDVPIPNGTFLEVGAFKIIDGLQRTYRLKTIYDTKSLYVKIKNEILTVSNFQLNRKYREELNKIHSSSAILSAIREFDIENGDVQLSECFSKNYLWFEIWKGLTPNEEIKKMLVLNAGHKPVNIKHQLELLFLNILPKLREVSPDNITVVREKDLSANKFSKERSLGNYHFSHLISALISFVEEKPVTTNSDFVGKIQSDDEKLEDFFSSFTFEFIKQFILAIYKIDKASNDVFGEIGLHWMGREVSLVAMFAAIGKNCKNPSDIELISTKIADNIKNCNLKSYEECRNKVDLAKVNIGNINKKYIYEAFSDFIQGAFSKHIRWESYFGRDTK